MDIEQSPEESFRVNYFLYLVDQAIFSLKHRFEQFQLYENNFEFLFDFKTLISLDEESLKKFYLNLSSILTNDNHYDFDGIDLFSELKILKAIMPKEKKYCYEYI